MSRLSHWVTKVVIDDVTYVERDHRRKCSEILLKLSKDSEHKLYVEHLHQYHDYYILTEFIKGKSLNVLIDNFNKLHRYPDVNTVTLIMDQLIACVDFIHKHNICHGDLAASNVMLPDNYGDHHGHLILIDFEHAHERNNEEYCYNSIGMILIELMSRYYDKRIEGYTKFKRPLFNLFVLEVEDRYPSDIIKKIELMLFPSKKDVIL